MAPLNAQSWAGAAYLTAALALPATVRAEQAFDFDIPAQPLSSALNAFAGKVDAQMSYPASLTEGLKSPGVSGRYTAEEALQRLLKGTGIGHRFTGNRTVTLEKPATLPPDQSATLGKMTVTATADKDPPSYRVTSAYTATKTDTPIMETPFSIQVVPRTVMDDQQVVSLRDSVQNVSGVQWSPVVGNLYEDFVLRGFGANASTARNGIREDSFGAETANVERVEVLKGSAAMLYGRMEPGGLINRVIKQPLFTPYYSLQQQFGSFDNYRTTVDATGPINPDLAYRINLAYQDTKSFRDFVGNERIFLAPSVTWRPTDRTELGLTFEYQNDDGRWDDGIPAIGNRPAKVPINSFLGDPLSFYKVEREVVDFHWSHQFNDSWKVNQYFAAYLADYRMFSIFPWSVRTDNQTMDLGLWNNHQQRNTYSQNINLVGNFDSWGAKHTLLAGFDFYIFDQPGATALFPTTGPFADGTAVQNLLNPIHGQFDGAAWLHQPNGNGSWGFNGQSWYGVYLQDQIKLWDQLHFLLGGRYDWATMGTQWRANSPSQAEAMANENSIDAQKFNPRFGILYQPWPWMSIYGSYSESLGANNGRDQNNKPLGPQEAQQFEVGMKNEFFDGRLLSTVAFSDLTKQNIQAASPNPLLAAQGVATAIGEARSRGIEYDLTGKLTENWSFIANYAWTDTRITKDGGQTVWDSSWTNSTFLPQGFTGNRLPLAPEHSANLWVKYDFTDGMLKGLSLGTGARIVSQAQGDPANDFQIPGHATWNAMAAYKHKMGGSTLTAQLNAYNLLDKHYFAGVDQLDAAQRFNIIPAAPLNFMGSVRLEY